MLKKVFHLSFLKNNWPESLLILLGSLSWILTMFKSGLEYSFGLGFWGPNGHDGIWHIALANSLARGSIEMPVFSGSHLQNYHLGFDLLLALLKKITPFSTQTLYFQILPIAISISIGFLTLKLVNNWTKSKKAALWSTFFIYFGGSFGWLLGKGESAFWSQQAVSTLINPPFALSIVFMLLGLLLLNKKKYILAGIVFGILIQVKAYAGVLALGSLLVVSIWELVIVKKLNIAKTFIISLLISIVIFLPFNAKSSGLIIFKPFWFLETMMQLSDRVGWLKFGEAMINYKLGHVWIKAIAAYLIAFLIFWYGNISTRLLAEIYIGKRIIKWKKIKAWELFLISTIFGGILAPMLFLQQGSPWNTIQFLYYSLFFTGILAGITLSKINSKALLVVIVLVTLPTSFLTLKNHYLPPRPPAMLPSDEYQALTWLAKEEPGIVLTFPYDKDKALEAVNNPPRPLYLYESTAYVSAFADKPVYLEDEVNLDITGFNWRQRRENVQSFIKENDQSEARRFLADNKIKYIYWIKPQRALLGEEQLGLEKIYENETVDIYKVIQFSDE